MKFENKIIETCAQFDPISLNQMDRVKLMRRTDTKFVFNIEHLTTLLEKAHTNYYMVEIKDKREQLYQTTYFDTLDYRMYKTHHNGKLNRHKIRIRKYVYSDLEFLEIKQKNNKGETIKNRIRNGKDPITINTTNSINLVEKFTPYHCKNLEPTLGNKFIRLTLVNKDFSERITLDYKLKFTDLKFHSETEPKGICIAEIKKGRDNKNSQFIDYLHSMRIQSMGFSKYCIGMALLNPEIKNNLFKQKIRTIVKI